jgi:hypothetical protein
MLALIQIIWLKHNMTMYVSKKLMFLTTLAKQGKQASWSTLVFENICYEIYLLR